MSVDSLGGRGGGSLHSQNGASKVVVPHWGGAMETCKAALKAPILKSILRSILRSILKIISKAFSKAFSKACSIVA
jgi:hypothetical protein